MKYDGAGIRKRTQAARRSVCDHDWFSRTDARGRKVKLCKLCLWVLSPEEHDIWLDGVRCGKKREG
jgi:Zn-finger protein